MWSSLAVLAFASFRQPRSFKEKFVVSRNETTEITTSDVYLQNIEKMSKSRNNFPGYIEALEKKARRKRQHHSKARPPVIIPISVEIPGLMLPQGRARPQPKSSESGQFVLEETKVFNFTNIGGYDTIKEELTQVAHMMLNPTEYEKYGVRVPKGILLEGPPGNGKTLLAKCFAGEIQCNFVRCAGSEFNEKYIGVGSSRLRELFKFAAENQPVVLFVDEFDAIGRKRGDSAESSSGEKDTTLNQLLVLMDGFENIPNMLVVAATNRADILDPAVVRPGRFDKVIHIPNPDFNTRKEIARIHKGSKPIEVDDNEIAQMTPGFSGAMIENLLNEATLWGVRHKELPVGRQALDDARQQIVFGSSAIASRNMSATILERIAVHETGHMLNALVSEHHDKPVRVSINIPHKDSLGHTIFQQEDEDEGIFVREHLDDKVRVLLGGRAAEEIVYGHQSSSTGSTADLEMAFQLARRMIVEFGMGKHIIYPFLSEDYKKRIDEEIHAYIHQAHQDARQVILKNMGVFRAFVRELLDRGTLQEEEIDEIFRTETSL